MAMTDPSFAHHNVARIAILGAGAIGQLLYHKLSLSAQKSAENEVAFIGRASPTHQQNLSFIDPLQQIHGSIATVLSPDDDSLVQVELLLVCVKAYQVEQALIPLLAKLSPRCHIVLLHNGLGPHLPVAHALSQFQQQGLSLGTTSQAALKLSQWQVKHSGIGVTQLGHYCGTSMSAGLKARLNGLQTDTQPLEWHQPVLPVLWQKLAINAVINPLTALNHCTNGQLAAPEYQSQISAIIDELVQVAKQEGIALDNAAITARVYQVIKLTAANYSSMYQDVAHNRATEINNINGYICQQAQVHHLNVPNNQDLVYKMMQLSQTQ